MSPRPKSSQPIEYSLLLTATLCLLAFGVVMVFSASSTTSLLGESGDGAYYLKRTLIFGARRARGDAPARRARRQAAATADAAAVGRRGLPLPPGDAPRLRGRGQRLARWLALGPLQIQPSELMKVALILFAAQLLAARPAVVNGGIGPMMPVLGVVGACV